MEKLPDPPNSFDVDPIVEILPLGCRVWRIYFRSGRHPTAWNTFRRYGPTSSRFDHHQLPKGTQDRGILYGAVGPNGVRTALAETFQTKRDVDRHHNDPWLAAFDLESDLELLDTRGEWPIRARGNAAINSGARSQSRKWSQAIYNQYTTVKGISYPSSLNNDHCVALYERADAALPLAPSFNRPLSDPALFHPLSDLVDQLNFSMK